MTEITIHLPDKLHQKATEVALMNNIPIDKIIAASLTQHLFRMMPDPYLEERAKRATSKGLASVLSQVPDVPPADYDKLPPVQ